ncbi:MAG: D-cysteine desulfhydrase family protein [Gammaproteobacteria bacterium]
MNIGCINNLPRVSLGHSPTPIDEMPNLSRALSQDANELRLLVKRDDCTGLAFGGNKVRQLEFYLGEAVAQGADTILITGAVQSNFVRLAAAAARNIGMGCHVQLEERVNNSSPLYRNSGNVLLDKLLGATLHSFPEGEDEQGADRNLEGIAQTLRAEGKKPYIIHLGAGYPPLGALGYVLAAEEIMTQMAESNTTIDEIVVASGSGATHAGLLYGLRALGHNIPVKGICVRRAKDLQHQRIVNHCQAIANLLQMDNPVSDDDVEISDNQLAPGYGQLNDAVVEAMQMAAHEEGLILDPVYTGRSMAGFIQRARESNQQKTLLFIHTGGQPAIFAYEADLEPLLGN